VTLILAEKGGVDKKVYFCYPLISPAKEGKQNKRVFLTNNECKGYRVLAFSNKSRQDPALALAGEHFLFKPQGRTIFFLKKKGMGGKKSLEKIDQGVDNKVKKRIAPK
jgi:hypothetical protein